MTYIFLSDIDKKQNKTLNIELASEKGGGKAEQRGEVKPRNGKRGRQSRGIERKSQREDEGGDVQEVGRLKKSHR